MTRRIPTQESRGTLVLDDGRTFPVEMVETMTDYDQIQGWESVPDPRWSLDHDGHEHRWEPGGRAVTHAERRTIPTWDSDDGFSTYDYWACVHTGREVEPGVFSQFRTRSIIASNSVEFDLLLDHVWPEVKIACGSHMVVTTPDGTRYSALGTRTERLRLVRAASDGDGVARASYAGFTRVFD